MMDSSPRVLAITQALSDPLRLAVLHHLMAGPATVSELMMATTAGQSRLSNHLAVLREGNLVRATRQGRQIIYELRDAAVGRLVESLAQLARPPRRTAKSAPIARARTCYDHLAGRLGVALFAALIDRGALRVRGSEPDVVELGPRAEQLFGPLGVDLRAAKMERRRLATACLDWTERRPHLGGALGAALWAELVARGWIARRPGTRAVSVTPAGGRGFRRALGVRLD
jgi:DNA-binding transcriptional ArsR family regulator